MGCGRVVLVLVVVVVCDNGLVCKQPLHCVALTHIR